MGKVITTLVNRFDGGMKNMRNADSIGGFSVSKGFDIFSFSDRIVPNRTSGPDTASTGIGNLLTASDGVVYGLGVDSNNPTTNTQLYKKATYADDWSALSNEKTGTSALNFDLFIDYPSNGTREIHCAGNGGIATLDKENVASVDTHTLSFTSVTQGAIHPKDDILYIPYTTSSGTFIAKNNAGSWTDIALTLPSKLVVTSITPYGNYLAIACAPRGAFTLAATGKTLAASANGGSYRSVVFLWDRDSSLTTLSESIDWGTGILQVLNSIDGRLMGISNVGGYTTNIIDRNSIAIKTYSGGTVQMIDEIFTKKQTTTSPSVNINPYVNFVDRNKWYFSIDIVGGSTSPKLYGLWCLSRSPITGRYAITIDRGATTDNSETSVLAATSVGDYFSMVHTSRGTLAVSVNTSSFASIYVAASFLESTIFNLGDSSKVKKLIGVTVMFEPLIASAQVVLKYRKNEDINDESMGWTTIYTYGTDEAISHSAVNIESTGANLPEFKEIQFRIESTGGAVITGLKFNSEIIDKDNY